MTPKRHCEDCGKDYRTKDTRTCRIELVQEPKPHIKNYCPICQRYCFNLTGPWTYSKNQYRAETEFKYRREQLEKTK